MSLFNSILSALDNPEQEANPNQLGSILQTVQSLSSEYQTDPGTLGTAMAIAGKYVRSGLQEKRNTQGEEAANAIVNQYSGTSANSEIVNLLLGSSQIQQLTQEVEQKTGLSQGKIQNLLPMFVPLVLQFLKSGSNTQNPQQSNSVLNAFLDTDQDGDLDMKDALNMASKYFTNR